MYRHTITLLISCPDQSGIVAAVSQLIANYHGNIVQSDQHVTNIQEDMFFMRVSFAEDSFTLNQSEIIDAFTPIAHRFHMQWSIHYSRQRLRAGIFVSKLDHCLTDLLWRWKSGELGMDIPFIISNHPNLENLAQMYGIPYHLVPIRQETRQAAQQQMLDLLLDRIDFLVLARYMQIL